MNRNSPYFALKYRVDFKGFSPVWETIAAFNSDRIALTYANDCRYAKRGLANPPAYRVMERTGKGWIEITKPEY